MAAQELAHKLKIKTDSRAMQKMQWIPGQGYLRLRKYTDATVQVPTAADILQFLMSYGWAGTIPRILNLKVMGNDTYSPVTDQNTIPLFTPSAFKGLEADGVIMYLGSIDNRIVQRSCVGLSRARFYLHVLGTQEQLARLPKLH
jgi:hypothetical protein